MLTVNTLKSYQCGSHGDSPFSVDQAHARATTSGTAGLTSVHILCFQRRGIADPMARTDANGVRVRMRVQPP
jgi:hypothetical protein